MIKEATNIGIKTVGYQNTYMYMVMYTYTSIYSMFVSLYIYLHHIYMIKEATNMVSNQQIATIYIYICICIFIFTFIRLCLYLFLCIYIYSIYMIKEATNMGIKSADYYRKCTRIYVLHMCIF